MHLHKKNVLPFSAERFFYGLNDKPGYVVYGHLSRPSVAGRFKRPT